MNKKNILIFVGGMIAGAVVGIIAVDSKIEKKYREKADEEIQKAADSANEKIRTYKDQIKKLKEKISQQKVTINVLADQVREGKGGDISDILGDSDDDTEDDPGFVEFPDSKEESPRVQYRHYASRYGRKLYSEDDFDDEYEELDPEEEEEIIKNRKPRMIDESTFSTTALHYSKEDIDYYMQDGKVLSEDGEYLDGYAGLIGEDWLSGDHEDGDECYVRNDNLHSDYHITFIADKGERHISDVTEDWED